MPPSRIFLRRKTAVSELYASMLMIGVTLATGGLVASAAIGQFGLADSSAPVGAGVLQSSADAKIALIYLVATPSGSCPVFGGYREGTSLTLEVYNYGAATFDPALVAVNSTVLSGPFSPIPSGTLGTLTLFLGGCAHPSGQTILVEDIQGDAVQLES